MRLSIRCRFVVGLYRCSIRINSLSDRCRFVVESMSNRCRFVVDSRIYVYSILVPYVFLRVHLVLYGSCSRVALPKHRTAAGEQDLKIKENHVMRALDLKVFACGGLRRRVSGAALGQALFTKKHIDSLHLMGAGPEAVAAKAAGKSFFFTSVCNESTAHC